MAGKKVKNLLSFIAWITGILVSLAVGFAMTGATCIVVAGQTTCTGLTVLWIPLLVTKVAGWIVVITTVISAVLALMKQ